MDVSKLVFERMPRHPKDRRTVVISLRSTIKLESLTKKTQRV